MTSNPAVRPEIIDFYTRSDEAARLHTTATGTLELARTRELLRRYLPPAPARVLDVGGGPGTYARWLAADGYTVTSWIHAQARQSGWRPRRSDSRAGRRSPPHCRSWHVGRRAAPGSPLPPPQQGRSALRTDRSGPCGPAGRSRRRSRDLPLLASPRLHRHHRHYRARHPGRSAQHPRPGPVRRVAGLHRRLLPDLGGAPRRSQRGLPRRPHDVRHRRAWLGGGQGHREVHRHQPLGHGDARDAALAAARLAEPHSALTDASAHILAVTRS